MARTKKAAFKAKIRAQPANAALVHSSRPSQQSTGAASSAKAAAQAQRQRRKADEAAKKRNGRLGCQLAQIVGDWCQMPPACLHKNVWYGVVRYKDYLSGQNTPTVFDEVDASQRTKQQIRDLGIQIREDLVAQLPVKLSRGHSQIKQRILMTESQLEEILRLKDLAMANRAQKQSTQSLTTNGSEDFVMEEEQDSKNAIVKQEDDSEDVLIKKEDDDVEHVVVREERYDDDQNIMMEDEEGSESSYDPEDRPALSQVCGASQVRDDVNDALEAVKSHGARAAQAAWTNPHAALVWAQVISEDLTAAAAQLRAALDSQNT